MPAAFSISDYVRWSAVNPAKIWGLYPRKGVIQPGADADIAIVDLAREWTIDDAKLQSLSQDHAVARPAREGPADPHAGARPLRDEGPHAVAGTRGWGRSVHAIQNMPPPHVRNADQTMAAIVRGPGRPDRRARRMMP